MDANYSNMNHYSIREAARLSWINDRVVTIDARDWCADGTDIATVVADIVEAIEADDADDFPCDCEHDAVEIDGVGNRSIKLYGVMGGDSFTLRVYY